MYDLVVNCVFFMFSIVCINCSLLMQLISVLFVCLFCVCAPNLCWFCFFFCFFFVFILFFFVFMFGFVFVL